MMATIRVVCLPILVVGFLFVGGARAQARSVQKIKVLTLLGRPLQFAAADKQGLFAKYGLEVETENLPNSDVLRPNLAAGKGDLADLAVDNAVAMGELAHQHEIIGMGGEGSQIEVMTLADSEEIKDV